MSRPSRTSIRARLTNCRWKSLATFRPIENVCWSVSFESAFTNVDFSTWRWSRSMSGVPNILESESWMWICRSVTESLIRFVIRLVWTLSHSSGTRLATPASTSRSTASAPSSRRKSTAEKRWINDNLIFNINCNTYWHIDKSSMYFYKGVICERIM